MKILLPTALSAEIEYWNMYREERIVPKMKRLGIDRYEVNVSPVINLYGRDYNRPLDAKYFLFMGFTSFPRYSVLEEMMVNYGSLDFDLIEKKLEEADKVSRLSMPRLSFRVKHDSDIVEEYGLDSSCRKMIGQLMSFPFERSFISEKILFELSKLHFERFKKAEIKETPTLRLKKKLFKTYRETRKSPILRYMDIFAFVFNFEQSGEYVAYTPGNKEMDIEFSDMKKDAQF